MLTDGNLAITQLEEVSTRTAQGQIAIWGYGVGGALSGLLKAGELLGREDLVENVAVRIIPNLNVSANPADHLINIGTLLELNRLRPDLRIENACERFIDAVLGAQRPKANAPPVHRPDLDPWSTTIWVDCFHTDAPGLLLLGETDAAIGLMHENATALQRADGLFHHGYDVATGRGNDVAWGRGQGWALLGLVDTLRHVYDGELHDRLRRLLKALAQTENDGTWHTVVDSPSTPVENSVAGYVAVGLQRARSVGLIDSEFDAVANRAEIQTLNNLDNGALAVSEASPVGSIVEYAERNTGIYPWGQAPVLELLINSLED